MADLPCMSCGGEGRNWKSKHGGNDPDVWDAGPCPTCEGSGNEPCSRWGCDQDAHGFNDDGEPMCEECLLEVENQS